MTNLNLARTILRQFVEHGLLAPDSSVRDGRFVNKPGKIEIVSLRTVKPKLGAGTAFLKALKDNRIEYDINWPTKSSIGFWRKMHSRGLLPNPVESYREAAKKYSDFGLT